MTNKLNKIGVLTSGGDSPGMNAAVRAVVRSAEFHNIHCYGIYKGFEGLISDEIKKLNARSVKNIVNKGSKTPKNDTYFFTYIGVEIVIVQNNKTITVINSAKVGAITT